MFQFRGKRKRFRAEGGFTLVEIMVSVAIFSIVVTMGMASLLTVMDSYRYAEKKKKVYDTLDYVVENMTRELRLGENYYFRADENRSGSVNDGSGYIEKNGYIIGFDASDERGYMIYLLDNAELYREDYDGEGNVIRHKLTDNDQVVVRSVRVMVANTDPDDLKQPLVWFQIEGEVPGDEEHPFTVQSLVSQRVLDIQS